METTGPDTRSSGTMRRPGRLLVVDDHALITSALKTLLSDEFEVTTANSGAEALGILADGAWFDVILSDVNMPGMNGLQLLEEVARAVPELAPRVVFVTAGVDPQTAEQLERLPNLVLEKPVELGHIRDLVRRRSRLPMPSLADAV